MTVLDPVIHFLVSSMGKKFTLEQVMEGADRPRRPVLRVMDKLTQEGYLQEIEDNQSHLAAGEYGPARRNPTWEIVCGLDQRPPRNLPKKRSFRSKIWKLIRAKHRFTKSDLVISAGCSTATVDQYVRELERAGYLRRTGKDGSLVTYMLIKPNQVDPPTGLFGGAS